jgi:plasmid maintenance system antidote protein VapI
VGAEVQERRAVTAREMAEGLGMHPRTVRKLMAEPRPDFLARAAARRSQALELRAQGLKHREIAEAMGVPIGTVGRLLWEAKRLAAAEAAEPLQQSA